MTTSGWRGVMTWFRRRPAVVPLLVLAAVLIAIGGGRAPTDESWAGIPDLSILQDIVTAVLLVLSAIGLLLLFFVRRGPTSQGTPKRRPWWPSLLALALVSLLILLDFEAELTPPEEPEEPVVAEQVEVEVVEPGPGFETGDGVALVVVLTAALALLWWSRRRGETDQDVEPDASDEAAALSEALARAEGHLLDHHQPRDAVLLAYRDLESTLETLGLARRSAETPTEHLQRALTTLGLDDPDQTRPLLDLATLYARARFSDHPVTVDEQHRAAEALGRARRHLVVDR